MATTTVGRPPLWRDVRVLAWAFQLAVVAVVVAIVWWLYGNYQTNTSRQNLSTNWDYLSQPAGFPVPSSDFRQTQPVSDALVEGLKNTLRLAITGVVLATVLGALIGIARLSTNYVLRNAARAYVEFVRNVPLVSIIVLTYLAVVLGAFPPPNESWDLSPIGVFNVRGASVVWFEGPNWKFLLAVGLGVAAFGVVSVWRRAVSDRTGRPARTGLYGLPVAAVVVVAAWTALGLGITAPELDGRRITGGVTMTAAYLAALIALVAYTSSHIAEIVRGSIQAVPRGQGEAADSLALNGFQRMWHVVLPQALRIGLPPIGNQYLNLSKNSSLAAIISFPELTKITELAVATRSPSVPAFVLLLGIYLVISLVLSAVINLFNRRLAIVER
jgi:general L-amino acid transport system permease protein